jgi:hypothetical protein
MKMEMKTPKQKNPMHAMQISSDSNHIQVGRSPFCAGNFWVAQFISTPLAMPCNSLHPYVLSIVIH